MSNCDVCLDQHRNRRRTRWGSLLCSDCRGYFEWFDSLSQEDRRAELALVLSYEGTGV